MHSDQLAVYEEISKPNAMAISFMDIDALSIVVGLIILAVMTNNI
jgi:hypothetical protein